MLLGIKGILNVRKHGHDKVFEIAFYGYLLVGTGSFLFHSTLKCKIIHILVLVLKCQLADDDDDDVFQIPCSWLMSSR